MRFIGKSILWAVALYACTFTALNMKEISNTIKGEEQTIVYTNTQNGIENIKAVKVSIDSLHRKIGIANKVIKLLQLPLNR